MLLPSKKCAKLLLPIGVKAADAYHKPRWGRPGARKGERAGRPEKANELMQFLQASNWMLTSLPELAELEAPLWGLLEECLCNARRIKRVAARRAVDSINWTDEGAVAWDAVRLRMSEAVALNHLKPGFCVMIFHASDKFWGSCITQVPTVELGGSLSSADMSREPLGFLSRPFRSSQERWETVDKESFAIVSTHKRLPYLLWGGVAIHCDHWNLGYIFGANGAPTCKAVAQDLQG